MNAIIFAMAALVTVIGSARAESGIASRYSTREQGTKTASGRPLRDGALTAAHKTLPFGSRVRVTNHANGRSVIVTDYRQGSFCARQDHRSHGGGLPCPRLLGARPRHGGENRGSGRMTTRQLKSWPDYFAPVLSAEKRF